MNHEPRLKHRQPENFRGHTGFKRDTFQYQWKLGLFLLIGGVSLCAHLIGTMWNQPALYAISPMEESNPKASKTPVAEALTEDQAVEPTSATKSVPKKKYPWQKHPEQKKQVTKLNYYKKPWSEVLKQAAEDTGAILVMHVEPHGTFTRGDWSEHSREETVRILNQELEPQGYRILEKDEYWTIISVKISGVQYPRYVSGQNGNSLSGTDQIELTAGKFNSPNAPRSLRTAGLNPQLKGIHEEEISSGHEKQFQVINHEEVSSKLTRLDVNEEQASRSITERVMYQAKSTSVRDIARQIYQAAKGRAELVESGIDQLPAFRLFTPSNTQADLKKMICEIGIDLGANRMLVHGERKVTSQMIELASLLDNHAVNLSPGITVLDTKTDAAALSQDLQPLINQSRQLQFPSVKTMSPVDQNWQSQKQVASLFQQEQPSANQPAPDKTAQPGVVVPGNAADQVRNQLPSLLEKLQGDVTVEALPDLNFLILRGNEKDVESVTNMIKAIEQMAVGSVPSIHIQYLKNVNSEALSTLLNDVYAQLATLKAKGNTSSAKSVTVIPVVKPNAILILSPESLLESVLELTSELDKPVDPTFEVEVFFLNNAAASEAATLLTDFYEARVGLGTKLLVTTDARTNSLIVQARPNDLIEIRNVVSKIDRDSSAAKSQLKVFRLKYTIAEEMSTYLNSIINSVLTPASRNQQGGGFNLGGGTQQFQQAKSMILEMLTKDNNAEKLVKSGLLVDIRISADARSNSLTITAPPQSMNFVEELVNILDQPVTATSDIKFYKLTNADATAAVTLMNTLFASDTSATNAVQLAGAENSSPLVPVKLSVDVRTNSVIASGSADSLNIVEAILLRLDESGARQRRTTVVKLRNRFVTDISEALNTFLEELRALNEINPDLVSTNELLEQEIVVTPELSTNSVIVSATPRYYEQVIQLINQLDVKPAQVLIQSLIVEVSLDDTDELGVELGFQDSVLFNRSSTANVPGFLFNNQALGNTVFNPASIGTQGLSSFALGRTNSDLGFGGLVLSASSDEVSVLIRALSSRRNTNVLSRPQVLVTDNQEAQIQVGQQVPIVNGVTLTNQGVANPNIIQDDAGVILTVTPRISPEGEIVMETVAEKSSFNGDGVPIFTDATTGNVITSPIKDITTARSTISVRDGQTIVLGGMITNSDEVVERKAPWLGDLPIIGRAFRFDSHTHGRTELLIFITPRIVHCDQDMEFIKQVEVERLNFFVDEAERIHGPIYGLPAEQECPTGECPPNMNVPQSQHELLSVPPSPTGTPEETLTPLTIPPTSKLDSLPQQASPERVKTVVYDKSKKPANQVKQVTTTAGNSYQRGVKP